MTIQWYPGHMHKAGREIKDTLVHVDLAIEILDARIPFSSQNPMLTRLRGDKPCIKVLNKCDLADPIITQLWQIYLEQEQGVKTLALSMDQTDKIKQLTELCRKLAPSDKSEGKLIQALIMGIPNVGKSTLINVLAGRTIAKTGDEPAITKRQQRIAIGQDVVLLDTPGMLWPNLENRNSGYRLAVTGAIKDTAITHDDIAFFLVDYLSEHYPDLLKMRFQLDNLPSSTQELMDLIGRKRGCLRSGGLVDLDRTAKIILGELRMGTLGKISLETPAMMEKELAELTIIQQLKAEKKQGRKAKRGADQQS
ncbi:MAG: ribosome biogenesis GTPase YlqF [Methyloglobulus sp.]|nr:ribosome biogenesis GTPase YlqF [Methyloglobulus sp.]